MIPRVVHQVWLGGMPMPPILGAFVDAVRWVTFDRWGPLGHYLWTERDLVDEFGEEWLRLSLQCCHLSQASDVARCLILEKRGGLYLDTDVELFELPNLDAAAAWIAGTADPPTPRSVNGCVLASEPGGAFVSRMANAIRSGGVDLSRHMEAGPYLCGRMLGPDVAIWPKRVWHGERGEPGACGHHYGWGPRLRSFLRAHGMPPVT